MAYIGNAPGVSSQRTVSTFTATSGQTTFTPSSGYTPGYIDVYQNGVKLIIGEDYTASNGTTVVLTAAASADDVVECVAYLPRGLSDGYTKAEADAKYALDADLGALAAKDTIATADIDDGAVTAAKLAAGAAVPSQTGQSGKYLTTDGTNASWGTITQPTPAAVSDQTNTSTGYFMLPVGTTAQRPASPASGMVRMNTTTGKPEWYETTTSSWLAFSAFVPFEVEYLIIAGGGSGANAGGNGGTASGGGGAGGVLSGSHFVSQSINPIVIGGGGAAQPASNATNYNGAKGGDSTALIYTAIGGGGGCIGSPNSDNNGGSGGGSYGGLDTVGSGTTGQGNSGGNGVNPSGGGGGGAGGAGSGSVGGSGTNTFSAWASATSTGVSGYYAGGGGGGRGDSSSGSYAGGAGGGGIGGTFEGGQAGSGVVNTGSGGGGGTQFDSTTSGGGGSGLVIIRYAGSQRATGGTVTTSGGYTYHTFTSSGTFTA